MYDVKMLEVVQSKDGKGYRKFKIQEILDEFMNSGRGVLQITVDDNDYIGGFHAAYQSFYNGIDYRCDNILKVYKLNGIIMIVRNDKHDEMVSRLYDTTYKNNSILSGRELLKYSVAEVVEKSLKSNKYKILFDMEKVENKFMQYYNNPINIETDMVSAINEVFKKCNKFMKVESIIDKNNKRYISISRYFE